jgi:hypothetical protein
LNRIEEEVTAAVSGEIDGRRLKTTRPWPVGPAVSGRKRERGYRFGELAGWAAGFFLCWAETVPLALFRVFISSLLFLFLFFWIESNLLQTPSNQFKPLSEIF